MHSEQWTSRVCVNCQRLRITACSRMKIIIIGERKDVITQAALVPMFPDFLQTKAHLKWWWKVLFLTTSLDKKLTLTTFWLDTLVLLWATRKYEDDSLGKEPLIIPCVQEQHCLLQRVLLRLHKCPISKMALLCVLYILLDTQFISGWSKHCEICTWTHFSPCNTGELIVGLKSGEKANS